MYTIKLGTQGRNFFLLAKDDRSEITITLSLSETEALSEALIETIAILKKEIEDEGHTQIKDDECNWYWVPNTLLADFKHDVSEIEGLEYMDDPDKFDKFTEKYSTFLTGGDRDLKPPYYEKL